MHKVLTFFCSFFWQRSFNEVNFNFLARNLPIVIGTKGRKKAVYFFCYFRMLLVFFPPRISLVLLFFSLDRPVTKNQILNTKCQQRFLLSVQFESKACPLLLIQQQKKLQLKIFCCLLLEYPMKRTYIVEFMLHKLFISYGFAYFRKVTSEKRIQISYKRKTKEYFSNLLEPI